MAMICGQAKSDISYRKRANLVRNRDVNEQIIMAKVVVVPPLALHPSQRLQQEALHGAFKGSICASAVTKPHSFRKQVCSIPHNYRVLSTIAENAPLTFN